MAFAVTVSGQNAIGSRTSVWGTFTSATGDTGGDVIHGLSQVDHFQVDLEGAIAAQRPKISHSIVSNVGRTTLLWDDTLGVSGRWRVVGL